MGFSVRVSPRTVAVGASIVQNGAGQFVTKRCGSRMAEAGARTLRVVEGSEAGCEDLIGEYLAGLGGRSPATVVNFFRLEDLAADRRDAHHARVAALRAHFRRRRNRCLICTL